MTYFYYKVKVKGQDLGHYLAKLLKRFRFSQNVFTLLTALDGVKTLSCEFKCNNQFEFFCD